MRTRVALILACSLFTHLTFCGEPQGGDCGQPLVGAIAQPSGGVGAESRVVELIPSQKRVYGEYLSEPGVERTLWDQLRSALAKEGLGMHESLLDKMPLEKGTAWVLCNNFPKYVDKRIMRKLPKEKAALIMWEPPVVFPKMYRKKVYKQFGKIFTWDDTLVDGKKFIKMYYPVMHPMIGDVVPFEEKKLLCMVTAFKESGDARELYTERENVVRFFETVKEPVFDLYGYDWDKRAYKSYRGTTESKLATMKNYRFAICFENSRDLKGYITEKIFDAFHAGCVPVYLGASNVCDYIPEGCFIDMRKFGSVRELYSHLDKMSADEYEKYMKNIREFLGSKEAKLFTYEHFVQTIANSLAEI
ncbi:MAG: hypothetical protein S4CHLAM102_04390 [Chlamydiia bacterium]|nr:hypothetical protein [Chlamydiia bacterium]